MRIWLPDRPGALGVIATGIGSAGGDLVGIDILERGGDRVIDELTIDLPDEGLIPVLLEAVCGARGRRRRGHPQRHRRTAPSAHRSARGGGRPARRAQRRRAVQRVRRRGRDHVLSVGGRRRPRRSGRPRDVGRRAAAGVARGLRDRHAALGDHERRARPARRTTSPGQVSRSPVWRCWSVAPVAPSGRASAASWRRSRAWRITAGESSSFATACARTPLARPDRALRRAGAGGHGWLDPLIAPRTCCLERLRFEDLTMRHSTSLYWSLHHGAPRGRVPAVEAAVTGFGGTIHA